MINLLLRILGFVVALVINTLDRALFYFLYLTKGKTSMVHDLRNVGTGRFKQKSVHIQTTGKKPVGETEPIRSAEFPDRLLDTSVEGVHTLDGIFDHCAKKYAGRPCLGARRVLEMNYEMRTMPDGSQRKWDIPTLSHVEWLTYEQVAQRVKHIAAGLVQWTGLQSGDKFAILEETCMEWMLLAQSCFQQNLKVVTVYATLGEHAVAVALNETNTTAVFTNENQLDRVKRMAKAVPSLRYVVFRPQYQGQFSDPATAKDLIEQFEGETGLKLISVDALESLGKNMPNRTKPKEPAHEDDVALIMYTSGTTGMPKGVILLHKNVVAAIVGIEQGIGDDPSIEFVYCGYLPLAHILELVAECLVLTKGGRIGYGNPKTLTDRGAKPIGDLVAISPSVMAGVPRVWETVKKGAHDKLSKAPPVARWLFNTAYETRKKAMKEGRETPLWNKLVFQKFGSLIGGNICLILSGGAPMNEDSQEFMRVCLGCDVLQGYGLTETCAATCVQNGYHEFTTGTVGPPVPCCNIKLVDVPEMGYSTSSTIPRGEIAVRGPNVAAGYYKREKEAKEVFLDDGWFMTGDIGKLNKDGTISVIDRKKNIVKLDHGEYIALEKLESIYGNSNFVSPNGICVYADSFSSYPVALVLPQQTYAEDWARGNNVTFTSFADLCSKQRFQNAVLQGLQHEARHSGLKKFEVVREVRCFAEEWTPENGMLTAAMKIKRMEVSNRYKRDIDEMYPNKLIEQ